MTNPEYQIGLFGTFDVENFGDLLFPIIAERELKRRLGEVKIRPFSFYAKSESNWPYNVTSLTELPKTANTLDGILVGGGRIIRFDNFYVPGYPPPQSSLHHPTGYWLIPTLIALQHGTPLIWNAPGTYANDGFPKWSHLLLDIALPNINYISVRDEESKAILSAYVSQDKISVMPDTAFGISSLVNQEQPSDNFKFLLTQLGITKPYIILQATKSTELIFRQIELAQKEIADFQILVLPISPVHGDSNSVINTTLSNVVFITKWVHPLLIVELINHSEGVIGHSFHLAITALSFGIPVFRPMFVNDEKFKPLSNFKTIYPTSSDFDISWLVSKLGKVKLLPEINVQKLKLAEHWDTIVNIILKGKSNSLPDLGYLLQILPSKLETIQTLEQELALRDGQIKIIQTLKQELALRDNRINAIYNSHSWKITAFLRKLIDFVRVVFRRR